MELKDRIKNKRLEKGYTLEELASKVGIGKSTLFKYESGAIPNIPSDKIEKIAASLETTPAYLMGWESSNAEEIKKETERIILLKDLIKAGDVLVDALQEEQELLGSEVTLFADKLNIPYNENFIENIKTSLNNNSFTEDQLDFFREYKETIKAISDEMGKRNEELKKNYNYLKQLYRLKYGDNEF